ncbi:MAG TPA: gamma-glutamyltransferase, partial [Gemmatimonadaceae bacterium]|nr:gamma-glutamyltransferase [Gemmatimonadaceae bacterium]
MRRSIRTLVIGLPLLAACGARSTVPSAASAPDLGKRFVAANGMVTAAHPQASEAGVEMLRRGGNAVDAAVATAFTLGVGEPQMSGLGGGGGMLIWLQREGRVEYIDFYSAQRVETWRGIGGLDSGVASLRVVGIPGEVAGLLEAHERYGKLSRAELLAPAIRLAEEGFPVNQILADMIAGAREKLSRFPASMRLYWPNNEPLKPGDILRNPELAAALRRIAADGPSGFYRSEMAREVVQVLNRGGHPASLADFAAYRPQWKRPLCTEYRGFVVLSA